MSDFSPLGLHVDDLAWWYKGVVTEVIDGDSLRIILDQGFNSFRTKLDKDGEMVGINYRVNGIDAAETRTRDLAEKARGLAVADYVLEVCPPGTRVLVRTSKAGKFGRYLVDVYLVNTKDVVYLHLNGHLLDKFDEDHVQPYDGGSR